MSQKAKNINSYWGECFDLADKDHNGKISLKELKRVLQIKNCYLKSSDIESHFASVANKDKELNSDQFFQLYENLGPFPIQVQLYEKYALSWRLELRKSDEPDIDGLTAGSLRPLIMGCQTMNGDLSIATSSEGRKGRCSGSASQTSYALTNLGSSSTTNFWSSAFMLESELEAFLGNEEKESLPTAAEIIEMNQKTWTKPGTLSFPGFLNFLMSDWCCVTKRKEKTVHMDMDQPLNHYFVNSSHNTYLEGNQITSNCSTDAYLTALKRGARFVELDIYPGSNGDEPIIKHSVFPTKPVSLRSVCTVLRDNGFRYSQYPLILSIEDHCDSDYNAKTKMNNIFTQVFDAALFFTENADYTNRSLPSPNDLRGKIIIKNKKHRDESFINICTGVSPRNVVDLLEGPPNFVVSLTKDKFFDLCKSKRVEGSLFAERSESGAAVSQGSQGRNYGSTSCEVLVEWTKKSQVKVYPANSQVFSGHYDPRCTWLAGVQYATLNFQTVDRNLVFNMAMFKQNGGCGYLLKPDYLLPSSDSFFNPITLTLTSKSSSEKMSFGKTILRVTVLSAMHLPKPNDNLRGEIIDPYVKVSLFDKFDKENFKSYKTKVVDDNGFNPVWNEVFTFEVDCPDLAFLLFEVFDKDIDSDDHIGQFCVHFNSLQKGYVTIPLFSRDYNPYPYSTLFARVEITTVKPRVFLESTL